MIWSIFSFTQEKEQKKKTKKDPLEKNEINVKKCIIIY